MNVSSHQQLWQPFVCTTFVIHTAGAAQEGLGRCKELHLVPISCPELKESLDAAHRRKIWLLGSSAWNQELELVTPCGSLHTRLFCDSMIKMKSALQQYYFNTKAALEDREEGGLLTWQFPWPLSVPPGIAAYQQYNFSKEIQALGMPIASHPLQGM